MEKTKARIDYGSELKKIRKKFFPRKNQTQFAEKINSLLPQNSDVFLDQKKISNLETGTITKNIPETLIEDLDEIFINMGYTMSRDILNNFLAEIRNSFQDKKIKPVAIITENDNLLSKSDNKIFHYYHGKYYCIFHSTDSSDPKCIYGEMEIENCNESNQTITKFKILENDEVIKEYEGVFVFNTHYNMWYSILVGKQKQEICMIAAQHFNSTLRNNQLNVALVITTSAGMQKRPTMHRMVISRNKIGVKQKELLLSQLKLNDDTIFISESRLTLLESNIIKDLNNTTDTLEKQHYNAILKCIEEIRKMPCESYYKIDEAIIYDSTIISTDKRIRAYALCKIREHTENKYYNKLSNTVHEICTKIMKLK